MKKPHKFIVFYSQNNVLKEQKFFTQIIARAFAGRNKGAICPARQR